MNFLNFFPSHYGKNQFFGVELYKRRNIRGLGLNNGDLYAYAGNNPVRYIDPTGRCDEFKPDEKQFIIESQQLAISNLNSIISRLEKSNDDDFNLQKNVSDYLGLDINKSSDRQFLIDSLTSIRDDLDKMTINDYSRSTMPMESYVKKRIITSPSGEKTVSYLKTIYLSSFSTSRNLQSNLSQPLHAQLVHETSHKTLHTVDIGYSADKDIINTIPKCDKRLNADNWSNFYLKMNRR